MKTRILMVSATALFLVVGGASFAQEQQEEVDEKQCLIGQATLCYIDAKGVRTCQTEKIYGPCEETGGPADPPADPNP